MVQINDEGARAAAHYVIFFSLIFLHHFDSCALQIEEKIRIESYTPRTWRTHPLHICPPEPYCPSNALTKTTLDWIFLISSLNFSFWSEKEGQSGCYGVEWKESWNSEKTTVWTGYWSLVAALNRGILLFDLLPSKFIYQSYSTGGRHPDHRSRFLLFPFPLSGFCP